MKKTLNKIWIGILALTGVVTAACCSQSESTSGDKMTRKQMKARVAEIKRILERRESECVYGSPEFMKEWRQETNDMKRELDSLQDVLHHRKRN